jgi:hypothetical protein
VECWSRACRGLAATIPWTRPGRERILDLERKPGGEEIVGRLLGALLGQSHDSRGTSLEASLEQSVLGPLASPSEV